MSLIHLLKQAGLRPKKGMGQNFLINEEIINWIVTAVLGHCPERLLEIGPGVGSLTVPLLRQSKRKRLCVVEQDASLIPLLRKRVEGLGNLEVIQGDALKVDFRQLAQRFGGPLFIVANLPYHISTPLLFHLLQQSDAIDMMVLMFQKEVAERISASPNCKAYGTLSVHSQLKMVIEPLFLVPASAFYPIPKVESSVIRLQRRPQPLAKVEDFSRFHKVVKAAFGQRRKTLRNALKTFSPNPSEWLIQAGIDPRRRGETLSVVEFVRLANGLLTMGNLVDV